MQTVAHAPQETPSICEPLPLLRRQEPARREIVRRGIAEVTLDDPADGLDVAQTAGCNLDVRLEVVFDILITVMASALFVDLRAEETRARPDFVGREQSADLPI